MAKVIFALAASALCACNASAPERLTAGSTPLTRDQLMRARSVPSFSPAEFSVDGVVLQGGVVHQVGSTAGESYIMTAISRNMDATLQGQFDLRGGYAPTSMPVAIQYEAPAGFDWVFENRAYFALSQRGTERRFAVRLASIAIQADGLLAVEFHGVDADRIDADTRAIRDGTDVVLTVAGRLMGSCIVTRPDGAELLDPRNSEPRCAALFAGL